MMPMPPCWASAMARCDSVTVSIAALTMGIFRAILRVSEVRVSASAGGTNPPRRRPQNASENEGWRAILPHILRHQVVSCLPGRSGVLPHNPRGHATLILYHGGLQWVG